MGDQRVVWDVNEVGARCLAWREKNFGSVSMHKHLGSLTEEIGEVARAINKAEEGIRSDTRGNLADELGDALMCVAALAAAAGVDLNEVLDRRITRMERLDFRADPENGGEVRGG